MMEHIDQSELLLWKEQHISQYILKEINAKLAEAQRELVDGSLIVSPSLEREYCRAIGEINGYEFFLSLIAGES